MSNIVFTPPRGLTFPVKKTPHYSTLKATPASRRGEMTRSLTPYPVWDFELSFDYLPGAEQVASSDAQYLLSLFMLCRGGWDSFLFLDPNDNSVSNCPFGVGDGGTTQFTLTRQFMPTLAADLVQNLMAGTLAISVAGAPLASSGYTLGGGTVNGQLLTPELVTFATAPAMGAVLTWTGSYYYRLRFVEDTLSLEEIMWRIWDLSSLKLQSIILP